MSVELPKPIAAYIAAENAHDTEALGQCFADDAVVRDEGRTFEGLTAIKERKTETKKKYQHTVEPLASVQNDGNTIVTVRVGEISPGAPSIFSSYSDWKPAKSHHWRYTDGRRA